METRPTGRVVEGPLFPPKKPEGQLTDEQVDNWREMLFLTLGPYALIMSKEDIQKYRDKVQKTADQL